MEGLISPGILTTHNALHSQAKFKDTRCAASICIIFPDVKTCFHQQRAPLYLPVSELVT